MVKVWQLIGGPCHGTTGTTVNPALTVRDAWIAGYKKNGEIKTFDEWKRCASLAIIWNDYKAGQHRIFNAENDRHLQVSQ